MRAAVLFAEGFEEIEAVTPVDVLRRAGVDVAMVGVNDLQVTGSHGISIVMDCLLEDVFASELDLLVLPGGLPGAHHLRDDDRVVELVNDINALGRFVASICAAPVVFEKAGILEGKKVTSHPTKEQEIVSCDQYTAARVEVDGNVITARGAGCSLEFSLALCRVLGLADKAAQLEEGMIAHKS